MTAFVLGNGLSRSNIDIDYLLKLGDVYGCNALYRTHVVTALVATDMPIARVIQESGYSKRYRFYTRRPLANLGGQKVPQEYFGFSSGPIAISLAAKDKHYRIYLLGFDLGPNGEGKFNNIYAGTEHYKPQGAAATFTGNWVKQVIKVANDFPHCEFVRVMGDTTAEVPEFRGLKNFSFITLDEFQSRINTPKDL